MTGRRAASMRRRGGVKSSAAPVSAALRIAGTSLAARRVRDSRQGIEQKSRASRSGDSPNASGTAIFRVRQTGAYLQMNLDSILQPIQHVSFAIDDSSLALMALLAGMIGGWRITGWRAQLKLKRARIERKTERSARKPD